MIEPSNPKVSDWDGAVASHAAYLFALAGCRLGRAEAAGSSA
jgi:hypothetical protein